MSYRFSYHRRIPQDLENLSPPDRKRIQAAIEMKLKSHPGLFGKPLGQSLAGCWSLRVGDYRVIYRIRDTVVSIEIIGHRSTVYSNAANRRM